MRRGAGLVLAMMLVAAQPAWAARLAVHEAAESMEYKRKLGGMIGRGALNVVTCPVDLIVNTVNDTKTGPALVGTLTGLGKGLGCGVLRLGSGAVDIVTFWVPGFNGFPVSDSYENCLATSAAASDIGAYEPPAASSGPVSTWEVPTSEPGAAQAPATADAGQEQPAKKWSK